MAVTTASLGARARRFVPSLTDMLFVVLALTQLNRGLFSDGDSGWHLWAGFDVLAHGPRWIPDTLSFTRSGVPWRNVEWLADAVLAACYAHGGYFGVAAFVSVLYAGLFAWLYRVLFRATGHVPAALVTAFLAAVVTILQLLARPLIFSFVLVFAAWELVRVPGRERLALFLLPPLAALWANLHPTAFIAPMLAAFAWFVRGRPRELAVAAVLSVLALGLTPWGFGWLHEVMPNKESVALLGRIDEWQTPRFSEPRFQFMFLYLLLGVAARRYGPRLHWGEAVLGMGCLMGSLLAVRIAPLAAILWAPYLARDLATWASVSGGWRFGKSWRAAQVSFAPFERVLRPGVWPVALSVTLLAFAPQLATQFPEAATGFRGAAFPHAALAAAERDSLGPRLLNEYGWGGYVSWAGGDRWKVFVDGRAGFFKGAVLNDYFKVLELRPGWQDAIDRWHPDAMLLQAESPLVAAAPLTGRWRVTYHDSLAALLAPIPPRPYTPVATRRARPGAGDGLASR